MTRIRSNHRQVKQRRGAAFVLLVTAVLLVVLAASQALIRGEVSARRSQLDRMETNLLLQAIEVAQRSRPQDPFRLPVDGDSTILVSPDIAKERFTATLYHQDQVIRTLHRPLAARTINHDESQSGQ